MASLYPKHKADCPQHPFVRDTLPQPNTMLCECGWSRKKRDQYWRDLIDYAESVRFRYEGDDSVA